MVCPFLEYRRESADRKTESPFDEPRAYCTAADRFVQAMRADICNDRYGLAHDRDCEIYLEHVGDERIGVGDDGEVETDGSGANQESEGGTRGENGR